MPPPVDPNRVLLTGENSFIRLSVDGGKTMSDRISHWRILWCPAGTGHALFLQSQLTGPAPRVYSDNPAVARWLQTTIESHLFPAFADISLPVHLADFERWGDPCSSAGERVSSDDEEVSLVWYDFMESFVLNAPPGFGGRPLGVFSTFFPARRAQVTVNGETAAGEPWSEMRGDRPSSTACLAWSETWVQPVA